MTSALAVESGKEDVSAGRIGALPLLAILAQLGLLALVLRQFQIESGAFLRLAAAGVRRIRRARIAAFAISALRSSSVLSLAGIALVLGLVNGVWLVAIGLVLIGICHLPIAFRWRVAILVAVGRRARAAAGRLLPAPWSTAIWPILGSMFMFRLIVYFYDLRHENAPPTLVRTLSYFFMLPNVCFPLFPVVDYKAFRRNYFDADAYQIYQTGVDWIVRGVIHLILYRFVYYYLTSRPPRCPDPASSAQFLVSNFLLYLRVSGLFHLIVGMLYLFGFHLPETHHRYLLASSFTDFWRRINIYWKDFMLKVFYYPGCISAAQAWARPGAGDLDAVRVRGHLGPPLVPVVLAARTRCCSWQDMLFWAISASWSWSMRFTRSAADGSAGSASHARTWRRLVPAHAADVRHVLRDLRSLVVLDREFRRGMALALERAGRQMHVQGRSRHHSGRRGDHRRRHPARES